MRTTILNYKQLNLQTGEILTFSFPDIMVVGRLEYIAKLNNHPHTYGCIYYVDESCIKVS